MPTSDGVPAQPEDHFAAKHDNRPIHIGMVIGYSGGKKEKTIEIVRKSTEQALTKMPKGPMVQGPKSTVSPKIRFFRTRLMAIK